jgi:hypothetical protein
MARRPKTATAGPAPVGAAWPLWLKRAAAILAFLAAALALFALANLPVSRPVEDLPGWTVAAGDELTLAAPRPGPLLRFEGPAGKGVSLSFARAAPTAQTTAALQAYGVEAAGKAPLRWVTHDGGGSAARIAVDLQPAGAHPALVVEVTDSERVAELTFRAIDARLRVSMVAPKVDDETPNAEVFAGEGEAFELGGGGAFPLEVEVPTGAAFTLRYAQAAAGGATFRWGVRPDPTRRLSILEIAGVRLRRSGVQDRLFACGAPEGAVSWTTLQVTRIACRPTLRMHGLDLSGGSARLDVRGPGFAAVKGKPEALSWKVFTDNPLISGVLGAITAGILAWTLRTVLAKPAPGPRLATRRRRRAS